METRTIVLLVISALLLGYVVHIYNGLVALKHNVLRAFANIDVLLKQRHDELPKLIEICKAYMAHEKDTLMRVTQARAAVQDASQRGDMAALGAGEAALRRGIGALFAVAESYPELKADQQFRHLRERITALENGIADRREFYNEAVTLNNIRIEVFPDVLFARFFAFRAHAPLEFSAAERADVDLKALFN